MATRWARSSLLVLLLGAQPAGAAGQLVLESSPPGAAVSLDGQRLGVTPLVRDGLPAGSHQVTVTRPGYAPSTQRVTIQDDLTTRHVVRLIPEATLRSGEMRIESDPAGSDVYLDGRWIGRTPLHVTASAGSHHLSVRRPGFEAVTRSVRVVSDLTTTQRIRMVSLAPPPPDPPPPVAAKPNPAPEPTPPPPPAARPTPSPAAAMAARPQKSRPPAVHPTDAPTPRMAGLTRRLTERPSEPPTTSHSTSSATNPGALAPPHPAPSSAHVPQPLANAPDASPTIEPLPQGFLRSPENPRDSLGERLRHAGFSLLMLGFVATLGTALWRQRARPLDWQPDKPSAGFQLLEPLPDDVGYLAAKATLSGIQRALQGDLPQARADMREAYRLAPGAASAYNLARAWEVSGMTDWAELAYRTALQHDPDHRDAGLNLANLLVSHAKPLDALLLYRSLAERHPDDGVIAFNGANLHASLGALALARQELSRARRLLPSDPAPRANLRIVKRRQLAQLWARALRRAPGAR